jgi:SAM-dependent methyltransferase
VSVVDIENQKLHGSDYDAITAFNILEHLRQPHQVIDKLCRALAPGGVLFGSVPNYFGLVGGAATRVHNLFDRTHVSTFAPDTWRQIFHHAGFQRVNLFGELVYWLNHSCDLHGKFWPFLSFNLMFWCVKP